MSSPDALPIIIYSISAFSLLNNAILLIVYCQCPLQKIKSYRYFFLFAAVQDITFSVTFLLLIPRVVSQDGFYTLIATGVLAGRPTGDVLLAIYSISFFVTTLVVTNSFIYRYLHLCRSQLLQKYSTTEIMLLGIFVNTSLLIVYCVTCYEVAVPDENSDGLIRSIISVSGVDMNNTALLGISKMHTMSTLDLVLSVSLVLIFIVTSGINVFCAKEIGAFLKGAALRSSSITLQRQMFILLLLQAGCPVLFVQMPFSFSAVFFFTDINSTPLITVLLDILMSSLPLVNPVIIIAFLGDYRNFVLIKLRLKKPLRGANVGTRSVTVNNRNALPTARASS